MGIDEENKYLFPSPIAEDGYFKGDVVLKRFAKNCGAQNPETLTTTLLRKHVATMTTLLNLRDNELDAVAKFMGHDVRIHREYYRLPHDAMQLAKVSKLFLAMEDGNLERAKGTNLDDVDVDDLVTESKPAVQEAELDPGRTASNSGQGEQAEKETGCSSSTCEQGHQATVEASPRNQ